MSRQEILERVSAAMPALPPSEQRVARLVLDDPASFSRLPIEELAYRSHVSKPSVMRFCRNLGYSGIAEFKRKLAGELPEGVPFVHRSVDAEDKTADVFVKVIDNAVAALQTYRDVAHLGSIDQAATAICRTQEAGGRLEFFGVGNSGIVAQDAQHKFFRLGLHATACSDGHVQLMSATLLGPRDTALVISNSGRTRELIDACDVARGKGATVIAVTCTGSPLASKATILLAVDHRENFDHYSPMVSRLLHLMLIDVLATATALRIGPGLQPRLEEMKRQLAARRDA